MALNPEMHSKGIKWLTDHVQELQDNDPELGDFSAAFEEYCMRKYSLGSTATSHRTVGSHDLGIDSYSTKDSTYHIIQAKIPKKDFLEANPLKDKNWGPTVVSDPRDALNYLFCGSKLKANESVQRLYGLIESDRKKNDFSCTFFLIVLGKLNARAEDEIEKLKEEYREHGLKLILVTTKDLINEFVLGSNRSTDPIDISLGIKDKPLSQNRYCYFLAPAADLFTAFQTFGWRLFDLNLRYEVRRSPVNGDIVTSLSHKKSRKHFHHYNNGLIITAAHYAIRDDKTTVRIKNPQVVNGLQTVKSIYNAVMEKAVTLEDLADTFVQVKLIASSDQSFISTIVQATNNQNPMRPRNLKANTKEQKLLRGQFSHLQPRWFFQVKEAEWESLLQENAKFFKEIVGYPPSQFKPEPTRKKGRVIDNQEAAKAWLAFIGFSDLASDRVTHYFSDDKVYEKAFMTRPLDKHWTMMGESDDFEDPRRLEALEPKQGDAKQYLFAYALWTFIKNFIPSPQEYREEALNQGVKDGSIKKASGSFTSPASEQDTYLADNYDYQTWRLMANMKEALVESATVLLIKKYGPLNPNVCWKLLQSFDVQPFLQSGDLRDLARRAGRAQDLEENAVFSRIARLLHHAAGQLWEDKKNQLGGTSRQRTIRFRRELVAEFKRKITEANQRKNLEKAWKAAGKTFIESLPQIS